jgi:RNA polymerase sigma-70 factor (ECF subfamily)
MHRRVFSTTAKRALPATGAIATCHATATAPSQTDWVEIVALYDELNRIAPTPVIALNRAVAIAMAGRPVALLAIVEELEQSGDPNK